MKAGLIEELVAQGRAEQLLFEAPQKAQQAWLVQKFGSNVNLGNIPTTDVIALETIRVGLRADTMGTPSSTSRGGTPRIGRRCPARRRPEMGDPAVRRRGQAEDGTMSDGKTIVVTGAGGYVGSALASSPAPRPATA